jgi:hypothetical protein
MSKPVNMNNEIKALNPLISDSKRCNAPEVPDLLKPNCKNFQESQNVDTSILDPVVVRSDYIRFVLDKRGILHSNSKISLRMKLEGDSHKAFFPISNGVSAIVKKCVLRAGSAILDSTDQYNVLSAYENLMMPNDTVVRKEGIKSGVVGGYKSSKVPTMTGVGVPDGTEQPSETSLHIGRDFNLALATTGTSTRADDKCPVSVHEYQDLREGSEFVLELSTLFKSLRFTQIPLFMIEQSVIIELFLEDKNVNRLCVPKDQVEKPTFVLDTDSPKLIADYIYYSSATMNSFAESNPLMTLPFFENQLIKTNVNYNTNSHLVRNLGAAGKAVNMVKICHTDLTDDLSNTLTNRYKSELGLTSGDKISYNLKVNDEFLFPVDIKNPVEQYVNTISAEGMPLNIPGREYDASLGNEFSDKELLELHDPDEELEGAQRWLTIYNLGGQRINNRGIELHMNVTGTGDEDLNQLVWLQMSKTLVLANGRFSEVYN